MRTSRVHPLCPLLSQALVSLPGPLLAETMADGTPKFTAEYWTAKQRAGHSLHEVSYRACFKPQLPAFFIEHFTKPGDLVYDPFGGRGTTALQAALMGRQVINNDINPLSRLQLQPRLAPPLMSEVEECLAGCNLAWQGPTREDLLAFYHPNTLRAITALRECLLRFPLGEDPVMDWVRMVTTGRLTGHSPGFFSVYTLPPNQAVSVQHQLKINESRQQAPPEREVAKIILKKSRSLLQDLTVSDENRLAEAQKTALFLTGDCARTPGLASQSVSLIVTSPPFLDVVQYREDNWLRAWFNDLPDQADGFWQHRKAADWETTLARAFAEFRRVLRDDGWIAFEVGEVKSGRVKLEENVIAAARQAGLRAVALCVNKQNFTKTARCWGVKNMSGGTNSNRIVLLRKA